jgi:hypothetical protein
MRDLRKAEMEGKNSDFEVSPSFDLFFNLYLKSTVAAASASLPAA